MVRSCRHSQFRLRKPLIFLACLLYCGLFFTKRSIDFLNNEPKEKLKLYPEATEVTCICSGTSPLVNLISLIGSIVDESKDLKVNFNILLREKDRGLYSQALLALKDKVPPNLNIMMTFDLVPMEPIFEKYAETIKELKTYYCHSKCGYIEDNFYLRPLYHLIFPNYSRMIALDVDLDFRIDLRELYQQFNLLDGKKVIAMGSDQTQYYKMVFEPFRRRNPGTKIGDPYPDGFQGLNTGVILFDLKKLRESEAYRYYLSTKGAMFLREKYSIDVTLGDQDFFTLLGADFPDIFYFLDCSWNRQLATVFKNHPDFPKYHKCELPIRIYHGNGGGVIPMNQE